MYRFSLRSDCEISTPEALKLNCTSTVQQLALSDRNERASNHKGRYPETWVRIGGLVHKET